MTYFGATDDFADGVESKLATHNYFLSFHRNVPCGTPRKRSTWNTPGVSGHSGLRYQVSGLETRGWGSGSEGECQSKAWIDPVFHVEHYVEFVK